MSAEPYLDYKKIFITGGTGTIGSQVVRELLTNQCKVVVYSRDQNKQFKMNYDLMDKRVEYVNGDICDKELLERKMAGSDCVIHCGASKHVPLCEQNADSAIKVNTEGTRNVLQACVKNRVLKAILLSTDKAVNPTSVMGCTKFLAERLVLEYSKVFPCSIVRLGNVFGSNGSVVPTFQDRIKRGLPLIVNSPNATRYFLTVKEAGRFIVDRLSDMEGGEVFIKKMKVLSIVQLAECMRPEGYPIEIGNLTQGEKNKELLITQDEARKAFDAGDYVILNGRKTNQCSPVVDFFTDDEVKEMLKECYA